MFLRAAAIWLLLLILAVLNGDVREAVIAPQFGEQGGHIVSTAILWAAIILVAWFATSWIGPKNGREAFWSGYYGLC